MDFNFIHSKWLCDYIKLFAVCRHTPGIILIHNQECTFSVSRRKTTNQHTDHLINDHDIKELPRSWDLCSRKMLNDQYITF